MVPWSGLLAADGGHVECGSISMSFCDHWGWPHNLLPSLLAVFLSSHVSGYFTCGPVSMGTCQSLTVLDSHMVSLLGVTGLFCWPHDIVPLCVCVMLVSVDGHFLGHDFHWLCVGYTLWPLFVWHISSCPGQSWVCLHPLWTDGYITVSDGSHIQCGPGCVCLTACRPLPVATAYVATPRCVLAGQ